MQLHQEIQIQNSAKTLNTRFLPHECRSQDHRAATASFALACLRYDSGQFIPCPAEWDTTKRNCIFFHSRKKTGWPFERKQTTMTSAIKWFLKFSKMFRLLFLLFHLIHGRDLSLQKVGSSTKNYFLPSTWQASLQQNRNINTINIRTSSTLTRSPSSAMSAPSLPSTWSWSSPATTSLLPLSMAFLQAASSTLHASQVLLWHEFIHSFHIHFNPPGFTNARAM